MFERAEKRISKMPTKIINATMCFLESKGRTLFLYRHNGKNDIHNGFYVPPGGRTERNETGLDCILREYPEESGLILKEPKLRILATFYNKGRHLGGDKKPDDWIVNVYTANKYSGTLKKEKPNAEPIWVPNREIKKINMYSGDRGIMNLLKKKGIFEVILQYDKKNLIRFDYKRVY
jgi:8-oxo-dGTP diphosphatase